MLRTLFVFYVFSFAVPAFANEQSKFPKTEALIEEGHKSYHDNCETCHGSHADSDTPLAANLNPKPRNLIKDDFKFGDSAESIVKTITNGIPSTLMASFKSSIPERKRWGIAYFILSLRHKKENTH